MPTLPLQKPPTAGSTSLGKSVEVLRTKTLPGSTTGTHLEDGKQSAMAKVLGQPVTF